LSLARSLGEREAPVNHRKGGCRWWKYIVNARTCCLFPMEHLKRDRAMEASRDRNSANGTC
jgi:hypothetical protein